MKELGTIKTDGGPCYPLFLAVKVIPAIIL